MKLIVTVAFSGDRVEFADGMLAALAEVVRSGAARRAALDVRVADPDLEPFGEVMMRPLEARAVVSLWDPQASGLALPAGAGTVGTYEVEEIVQKSYDRTWPSAEQSPGFKMIAFLRRRADLDHDEFSTHWRRRHGPLAVARQPGFWQYVQNHVVRVLTDGSPPWDGFGEIHYRNLDDALHRSYDSEEGRRLIREDVARFLDYEASPTLTTHEWVVAP